MGQFGVGIAAHILKVGLRVGDAIRHHARSEQRPQWRNFEQCVKLGFLAAGSSTYCQSLPRRAAIPPRHVVLARVDDQRCKPLFASCATWGEQPPNERPTSTIRRGSPRADP